MDARIAKGMKSGINKIFRIFTVQFKYSEPIQKSYDDDLGIQNSDSYSDYQTIKEPLFQNSSSNSNQLQSTNGGTTERYSYVWLSKRNVPNKTKVDYQDIQLKVIDRSDYQDVAGIYEYYLQGRSDIND